VLKGLCGRVFLAASVLLLMFATAMPLAAQGAKRRPQSTHLESEHKEADHVRAREEWFRHGRRIRGESAAELRYRAYLQKRRFPRNKSVLRTASAAGNISTTTSGMVVTPTAVNSPAEAIWTNLGPAPINSDWLQGRPAEGFQDYGMVSGRVTAVTVDQNDATGNTVYVGGAYGGVWKSTNAANAVPGNVVWTQLLDDQASLAVGAIAVSSNGQTILVGTGEPNNSGDSYYGVGILRSTDAGSNWTLISSANSGVHSFKGLGFSKIAFNTSDATKVVAASAAVNESGGLVDFTRGLYFSTDAGASWTLSSVTDSGTAIGAGSATDVVYNPSDNAFYAVVRFHGIYKSTNNGASWSRLAVQPTGLTAVACPATPTSQACPIYRGELAVRPGANEMYVWFVDANETNRGVFKTVNSGGAWTALSVAGINTCGDGTVNDGCGASQGMYNLYLAAVPNGSGTDLYAGAVNLFKCSIPAGQSGTLCGSAASGSTSGTNRWMNLTHVYGCDLATGSVSSLAHVHPDQHAIDFSRTTPNIIYFGNDGGIYRTLTGSTGLATGLCTGTNAFQNLNGTIGSMSQFVSFSQHSTDDGILLGGLQDNGSPAIDRTTSPGTTFWQAVNGGDGGFNDIDSSSPNIWYTANFDVSIQRCTQGTNCRGDLFTVAIDSTAVGGDGGAFYTPFTLDPSMPSRILVGTCRVWRGNGDGTGMTSMSNKLNDGGTGTCASIFGATSESAYVSALVAGGPTTGNGSQVIYAGLSNGGIFVTTAADSGAAAWANRTAGTSNPGFDISGIAIDPSDSTGQTAYITVMGFGTAHVYRTTNAGANWTDVSGDLPDAPADSVLVDPDDSKIVYVGTDVGVFVTADVTAGSVLWNLYGPNSGAGALPNVPVTRLLAFSANGERKLRASTYGRGVWEAELLTSSGYTLAVSSPSVTVYPSVNGTFNGTLTAIGSFSSPVNLSCTPGGGNVPTNCAPVTSPVTPTGPGAPFTIGASDSATGDYSFAVQAVGTDAAATTHMQAVTLHVIDFQLADGADIALNAGDTGQTTLALTLSNWPAGRNINSNCTIAGEPITGMSCQVTPSSRNTGGAFTLTVNTTTSTPVGTVIITVTGTDALDNSQHRSQTITVTVNPAPPSVITVVTPNGGESWMVGTAHTIQWTYSGPVGSTVKIELLKNGLLWSTVSTNAPIGAAGSGSFNWNIPAVLATASDYKIRITSVSNPSALDLSNTNFSLIPLVTAITVVSPNGGEAWSVGSTHAIQWSYSGSVGSTVRIELLKNGLLWSTASTNAPIGASGFGSFNWTIPAVLATASDYRIRVTSTSNTSINDLSDANFSLTPLANTIGVISPNGGESWALGSQQTVQWSYSGSVGSTVKIELLKSGVLWSTISATAAVGSGGTGSFNWTIPAVLAAASDYTVRVMSASDTTIKDNSNASFSLVPAANAITVTSPNGGESWQLGSVHAVQWTFTGSVGTTVKIELLKSGVLWSTISVSTPVGSGGAGSFNWTIPGVLAAASDYKVRITSNSDANIKDLSNAAFSLAP
jgi:hypothetical protein